jgi:hypothetical protein
MQKLREQGHRVVVLSNTNRLHTTFWPDEYPEVRAAADHIYLSRWGCVSLKREFISASSKLKVFRRRYGLF